MSTPVRPLRITMFGLSITSSWGNGHATTYRSLVKGLERRGHQVVFYERRQPCYEHNCDLRHSEHCEIVLYDSVEELPRLCGQEIADADLVMIGSYVPEGVRIAQWLLKHTHAVTAFYDIDTPVTVAALRAGTCSYLSASLVPEFDVYLSFSGGPVLQTLEREFGARRALPLYCSVDPELYYPFGAQKQYDLGYLGTYSQDRQPKVDLLLLKPARIWRNGRFCLGGPQYPQAIKWPSNIMRIKHVAPGDHCAFYNSQRFTLNVTRKDMVEHGFSPSVRLFEAAACAVPVISDHWVGLDTFFVPDSEILIARSTDDVLRALRDLSPDHAASIGARARTRVLAEHSSEHRALELERHVESCRFPTTPIPASAIVTRPTTATLN